MIHGKMLGLDRLHGGEELSIYAARRLVDVAMSQWFNVLAQIIGHVLLFLLVSGMSATVDVKHLRQQMNNKYAIWTGLGIQYVIMPLMGFLTVVTLKSYLPKPMAISLLIVTSSPGGSYSNWWCSIFNADLALSVTMTAIGTLMSVFMLPANLLLYVNAAFGFGSNDGERSIIENIDWFSLFTSVAIVIAAIVFGLCASAKYSSNRFNQFANRLGSSAGVLMITFSVILSSLSGKSEAQVWGQHWSFYIGVTAPCVLGLVFSTICALVARLRKPEVVSVGIECAYQNVGIATSAVVAMFDDPIDRGQALCVPLFFGVMEAVVIGIYCVICWKLGWTKAPKDVSFCTMISTMYEDDDAAQRNGVVGGPDEDRQEDASSMDRIEHDASWRRPLSLLCPNRKSRGNQTSSQQQSIISSLPHILGSTREGNDTIYPMAVPLSPDTKGEYSRCRINSEETTGRTEVTAPLSETA